MKIDLNMMNKMHDIQFDMLLDLIRVLNQLSIDYFFVHGSLLGAIRDHDFIPEDDDIDIAIFRDDYNKLFSYGPGLLKKEYFLQNSVSDMYPLSFGKLRNSRTAFIQPILGKINCNQGIYIDIFPIDFVCKRIGFKIRKLFLDSRCYSALSNKKSIKNKLLSIVSKIIYPNYYHALLKREIFYSKCKSSRKICIHGGKKSENCMDINWFSSFKLVKFRNLEVKIPNGYEEYLKLIYGENFMNYNPAITRINNERKVEISASILDFEKSYVEYI